MTCEEFNHMLDNYENLTEQEKLLMNEHAGECENCRDELDFMLKIIMQLNTLPRIDAPEDFKDKLNKRISLEDFENRKINRMINSIRRNYRRYSTVAACLVLAVIVGVNGKSLIGNMMRDDNGGVIVETGSVAETDSPKTDIKPEIRAGMTEKTEPEISVSQAKQVSATQEHTEAIQTAKTSDNASKLKPSEPISISSRQTQTVKAVSEPVNAPENVPQSDFTVSGSVSRAVEGASAPAEQNNVPQAVAARTMSAPESDTETSVLVENYTIARGVYRLPDPDIADAEFAASPHIDNNVLQDFAVDENAEITIARGRYYIMTDNGYINIDNNAIEINGEDAERAVELIQQYTDTEDDSYYVINSENISPMLEHMDREGINYQNNVEESDNDKVSFKLVIE